MVTFNVSLRREVNKAPRHKRAKKAISVLKQYIMKHEKTDNVKIGKHLNLKIWSRGIKNYPHKVKVETEKSDKGVLVELFGAPKEVKKEPEKKAETPIEKIKEKVAGAKPGKKEETVKEPKATEIKKSDKTVAGDEKIEKDKQGSKEANLPIKDSKRPKADSKNSNKPETEKK